MRRRSRGIPTLLEQAEDSGLATGVVTTTRITHATPGGTYAHTPSRDWESDVTTPAEAQALGCRDIARQLVEFSHGIRHRRRSSAADAHCFCRATSPIRNAPTNTACAPTAAT